MDINLIKSLGIQVTLNKDYPLICETLERIGVVNKKDKVIYPSCYCVEYDDGGKKYTICHFKEMFTLQGKPSTYSELDRERQKTIVHLIQDWGLVSVVNPNIIDSILMEKIGVVKHHEKAQYKVIHKFKNY